jgi:archaellum biogenesis protein FlaJ (TadC family)
MNFFNSPFSVPIAAMLVGAIAIIAGFVSSMSSRRIKAEQRMAMIARGMKAEEIAMLLNVPDDDRRVVRDPQSSLARARRIGIILCSIGVGAIIFFFLMVQIEHDHEIYSGAAAALVPVAIGIGFLIDYKLQKRDLDRSGAAIGLPPSA